MVIRVTVQHRDTPDTLVSPVIRGILESQATPAMVGRATRDTAGLVIPVMEGRATQAMAVPGTVAIAGQE